MTSKRAYNPADPFADYAAQQGAPIEAFIAAGWKPNPRRWCSKLNMHRPAWEYHTLTGWRVRYLDGQEPRHDSPAKYAASWYRLPEAIAIANASGQPLILVNGAAGVIAAQFHGLAAFAVSDGEQRDIIPMLDDLKAAWQGEIWIAQDCDPAGQASAAKRARALLDAGFIATAKDLQLGKNGDIADFCKLHGADALKRLADLPELTPDAPPEPRTATYTTSGQGHYSEWIREVPRAYIEKLPTRREGHIDRFQCVDPDHIDEHWSARISFDVSPDGIYICSCGKTLNWNDIAALLGLQSYKKWVKERYPRQKPQRHQNQRDQQPAATVGEPKAQPPRGIKPDIIFNAPYVSQCPNIPRKGVNVIIADKGTGKTETSVTIANEYKARQESVWVITPLIGLTRAASARYDVESYEALTVDQRRQANHLAITLPSIGHYATMEGDQFPTPKCVILDEFRGILEATLSRKLFKRGAATRVLAVLERIIQNAELVLVTDADTTAVEVDYLKSIRPDVIVIFNEYHRNYGTMEIISDPDTLTAEIPAAVAENKGTVYVFSNHKATIENLHDLLVKDYGEESILAVHSGNSTNAKQRAFLDNPNTDAYRAILVSPSGKTGLDRQAPVYKAFGLIHRDPLDAPGCLQGLARPRNVQAGTFVWIESAYTRDSETGEFTRKEGKREINAQVIYDRYRRAAKGTVQLCALNDANEIDFDGIHRRIAQLHARIEARRNRSLNNLRDHFLKLAAANYHITERAKTTEPAESIGKELAILKKERREQRRHLRLTLQPLSPEEHRKRSGKGIRTDEDNAALERWIIENYYKQDITEPLDDFDAAGKGRRQLGLFIDIFHHTHEHLKQLDSVEHHEGTPKAMLSHYTARRKLLGGLLANVFGSRESITPETELNQPEIEQAAREYFEKHDTALSTYFNTNEHQAFRSDHSHDAFNTFKRLLHLVGLGLEEKRRRKKKDETDAPPKVYRLNRDLWKQMNTFADTRLKGLAEEEATQERKHWQALQKSGITIFIPRESGVTSPNTKAIKPENVTSATMKPEFCTRQAEVPAPVSLPYIGKIDPAWAEVVF